MELRQLEHFVAVAEQQHFTRAAEELQISQSGLSASIRALESELGTPLFTRSTRRVELTGAGRAFLTEAIRTVTSATAAKNVVAAVRGVLSGTLGIGTEQCLGVLDLPAELAAFRAAHDEVEVRLGFDGSANLVDKVAAGRLDVALVASCAPPPRGNTFTPLHSEGFCLLTHPGHRLAGADLLSLDQVADEPQVGFLLDWGARMLAQQAFAAAGLRARVTMEVNDVGTLLDLVGHRLGVAIVPAHFATKRPSQLRAVPIAAADLIWTVGVALPQQPSPAASALVAQFTRAPTVQPIAAA
ncbi:MAG: LysR family transcriptional regulator [Propionibacteriaceae bacterium]